MGAVRNFVEGAVNHAENVASSYKDNPERALLGINTPYETKLWNSVLGTDYQPNQSDLLTQGTLYTDQDRRDAAGKGINLGSTKGVDAVAQAAAAYFGGQALGGALGGVSGGGEAPAASSSGVYEGDLPIDPSAGGASMPAAQPEADPTFGGQLQQTGPGEYSRPPMGGAVITTPSSTGGTQPSGQQGGAQQQAAVQPQPGAAGATPAQGPQTQAPTSTQPGATQQPGMVDRILSQMKANPLATAGTALLGAQVLGAGKPQTPEATRQQQAGAQDVQATAQQLLAQYRSGALSPGQQASLDQLSNQTKNQLRQYFASIGQADSTAATQALAQVDSQALQMKQQMLDNALNQGLQAIGISGGQLAQIAQVQLGQDRALNQAFSNFAGSLGNIAGSRSGTPTTVAPTISSTQA